MIKRILFLLLIILPGLINSQNPDSVAVRKIFSETMMNGKAYDWLRDLTKNIGGRLSGTPQAAKAVEWAKQKMIEAGADSVWLQEVWVPYWVRGEKETGTIIESNGNKTNVPICALGLSVATPKEGITAQIVEINNFNELSRLGAEKVKGKIVFYNYPFDEKYINTFEAYGDAVQYRWAGPSEAAKYGAVATICRSMTNALDDDPHTGAMHYADTLPRIPCAAISTNAANLLSRIVKANEATKFFLKQSCHMQDSVKSYNVIGEIKGSQFPNEYVVVGGHLDSWDLAEGAHDDGAGVVQSIEMLRTIKSAGIKPLRTLRAIAFMNEESGLRGGRKYAEVAKEKNEKHVAAIESDAGGFMPTGFGLNMTDEQKAKVLSMTYLFKPYGMYSFSNEGDGADISKLENMNVARLGLEVVSQRYFDYHHSKSDTFDKVNKRELLLGAAAMTAMAYLLALHGL